MFKRITQWMFLNRKKEAHILVAVAGAIGTTWASSQAFRTAVTHELALMPHWIQGLGAVLAFAVPIWKLAQKTLAEEGGAQ
jgi:CBS-domain-containing membrane protein